MFLFINFIFSPKLYWVCGGNRVLNDFVNLSNQRLDMLDNFLICNFFVFVPNYCLISLQLIPSMCFSIKSLILVTMRQFELNLGY